MRLIGPVSLPFRTAKDSCEHHLWSNGAVKQSGVHGYRAEAG